MKNPFVTPKKKNKQNNKSKKINFYWIYIAIFIAFIVLQFFATGSLVKKVGWKEFESKILRTGDVENLIVVNREYVEIYLTEAAKKSGRHEEVQNNPINRAFGKDPEYLMNIGSLEIFEQKIVDAQSNTTEAQRVYPNYETRKSWTGEIVSWLFFIGIILFVWIFIFRKMSGKGGSGGIFNIGKSRATLADMNSKAQITFKNVAGQAEAKEELKEIVDFLKKPDKYTKLGAKIPKGVLLVGPPGTGKTLLAKAISGEAKVPFFSLSGSDFVEMFVGVGAARVRDLFAQAKAKKPCIVFIDELDAIGRARGKSGALSTNDERENTLNQLLTEMDGFVENSGVILIAATNRAEILDNALLRPGRFDRQIVVALPDLNEREEIFKVHTKDLKISKTVDIKFFSKQTPGFSGADIANVCNEAALIAARKNKRSIGKPDFLDAIDRIVGGLEKRNSIMSPKEKETIAVHESGHATVSWFLKHADSLVKVSIVPRGQSLGAAWYLPEDRKIITTEQLKDSICTALGGRVAEEIIFGDISTGALNDLEKVTKQAYAMVAHYGLNEKVGNISFYDPQRDAEFTFSKPYSEKTANIIDAEVKALIDEQYKKTKEILKKNKDKMMELANALLQKEVIFKEDLERIFGTKSESEIYQKDLEIQYKTDARKTPSSR